MSSAVLEKIVEQPRKAELIVTPGERRVTTQADAIEKEPEDPHPLLPVLIAGAISLALSAMFVGSILAWIALRHSGVMAP